MTDKKRSVYAHLTLSSGSWTLRVNTIIAVQNK